jgi:hypothetical protein
MTNGNVLGFLAAPDRDISLRAISLALLKVRSIPEMTCEKLGEALGCSADTIRNASNEESMLSFDGVARLIYFFPDEAAPVRQLWERGAEAPTANERIERIERDLEAIRKELAA